MREQNKPLVAIIHSTGNLNSNTSLRTFVDCLLDNNYDVHYYAIQCSTMSYQKTLDERATIFYYNPTLTTFPIITHYSLVFGIDDGIIMGSEIAQMCQCPLLMISYEIMFESDLKSKQDKILKSNICHTIPEVSQCIVQDKLRGKFLVEEYGIAEEKLLYIPIAPQESQPYKKSTYLHTELNIPSDKKILLHFGSVAKWSMADWAIENAHLLPSDWVLVIHDRYGQPVKQSNANCYISTKSLPPKELGKLVQSADCTLALYRFTNDGWALGKNIQYIGMSSGKIATALSYGVPVATNAYGEISSLIDSYKAGIVIDTTSKAPFDALKNLNSTNENAKNCSTLFDDKLHFKNFEADFLAMCEKFTNHEFQNNLLLSNKPMQFKFNFVNFTRSELMLFMRSIVKELFKRVLKKIK